MVWGLNECLEGKLVETGGVGWGASREQKACRAKLNPSGFLGEPLSVLERQASNSKERPGPQDSLKTVESSGLPQEGTGSLPRLIRDSRESPSLTCFLSLGKEKRGVL